MSNLTTSFADYKEQGYIWITLAKGLYYPDYLQEASNLYKPYFSDYPNPKRPIDFVIYTNSGSPNEDAVLAVGLARYDSDRGGAQEDDRIGGYRHCADEILAYARAKNLQTKVIFLNDGPGLLLGTMWDDYARLEQSWPSKIMVLTLRMLPARLTLDWLLS